MAKKNVQPWMAGPSLFPMDENGKIDWGRPRVFESPEHMLEQCNAYFQWAIDNPLYESKLTTFQGVSTIEDVPHVRAFTLGGLHLFTGIGETCWRDYRNGNRGEAFSRIAAAAERAIYEQKFTSAAADLLNSSIIIRDLGLRDQTTAVVVQAEVPITDDKAKEARDLLFSTISGKK